MALVLAAAIAGAVFVNKSVKNLSGQGPGHEIHIKTLKPVPQTTTTTRATTTTQARPVHLPLSFTALLAKVDSGVIRITTTTCSVIEVGTGILISPTLVVTVDHVVAGASLIALSRNGKTLGVGTVIGFDPVRDVALVQSDTSISGYQFHFSSGATVLGEDVTAIGFPFGLPLTVTRGSVSGLGRTIPIDGVERSQLIQTDAPVNPGNSGGPLMTNSGGVVGLIDLGTDQANGLAFAVSSGTAEPLVQGWAAAPEPMPPASCQPSPPATNFPGATVTPPAPSGTAPAGAGVTSPATTSPSEVYQGTDFSIDYPTGWSVSHIHVGGGNLDNTFQPPGGPGVLIRVDEDPEANAPSVAAAAAPEIASLEKDPTYSLVSLTHGTFDGVGSLRWEFEDTEGGVRLHKVDILFIDGDGHGWAVLYQSPESFWSEDNGPLLSYVNTFSG